MINRNENIQERIMGFVTKEIHGIFDNLHETLSELKMRISKLEQYARLQDDINKKVHNILDLLNKTEIETKKQDQEQTYTFEQAIKMCLQGKKIKRQKWHATYWSSKNKLPLFCTEDFEANDWVVQD